MLAVGAQFGSGNVLGCCSVASRKGSSGYEPSASKHWCWVCHACHSPLPDCAGNLHRDLESNHPLRPHSADVACRGFVGAVFTLALANSTVGRLGPAVNSAAVIGTAPGDLLHLTPARAAIPLVFSELRCLTGSTGKKNHLPLASR